MPEQKNTGGTREVIIGDSEQNKIMF
jgi:phospholipid-translocating P-type ATPase (flippase)